MKAISLFFCFFTYLFIFLNTTIAQNTNFLWAKQFGTNSAYSGKSSAVDADGNVYTTGCFTGTVDFDPGPGTFNMSHIWGTDIYITKLDASGNFLWAKQMGGPGTDEGISIAVDANKNIYITGTFLGTADFDPGVGIYNLDYSNGDIFISKLDVSGNFLWAKQFGNSISHVLSLTLDANGNIYTTGNFSITADFDPGIETYNLTAWYSGEIFISKLDTSGNFLWAKKLSESFGYSNAIGSISGYSIAVDGSRNVFVVGVINYVIGNLSTQVFVSKLDAFGNFAWVKEWGGTGSDFGLSITLDVSGNVYTTGRFSGNVDFDPGLETYNLSSNGNNADVFVSKLDASGNFLWAKSWGGAINDIGNSITVDSSGNVYTTGFFDGTADFDPGQSVYNLTSFGNYDIFVSKLDASGKFLWAKQMGGTTQDEGSSIVVDANANVYVTGFFGETADFDPGAGIYNMTSSFYDAFILKLKQNIPFHIIYPKFVLNNSSINASQSISISGYDFTPNGTASINIYGNNGFSQSVSDISINAQGVFNYNYTTSADMPADLYYVQAVDNVSGLPARRSSFTLKPYSSPSSTLSIIRPDQSVTIDADESLIVEWKDMMITRSYYPIMGSKRNYKYNIDLSSDNGSTWDLITTIEGMEDIGKPILLNYGVPITTPGSNYKIRITDFYKNSNSKITPVITVNNHINTQNLQVSLDWDYSYEPRLSGHPIGIAADGVARIFLNLSKKNTDIGPNISNVTVKLNDAVNQENPTKLGKVMVATKTAAYDLEANGITAITATDYNNDPYKTNYMFWYVAPDDFAGADPDDIKSSGRTVTATFAVNYDNTLSETFTKKIEIVRPPLALVHGLASKPSSWDSFTFSPSGSGLHYQYVGQENYLFKQVSKIPILADAHFNTNALRLIDPTQPLENTLQGVILNMRNKGYAANQVDYVGHSMAGNVIRQATLFTDAFKVVGTYTNKPYKNYENGFVHKIITLNTPHNGSPWADLLTKYTTSLTLRYIKFYPAFVALYLGNPFGISNLFNLSYGIFSTSDAVEDLEVNDPGVNMEATNIKSHLIAGDLFPNISAISDDVVNTIGNIQDLVNILNVYWGIARALETDPIKKTQLLSFAKLNSPLERAVKYFDYFSNDYIGIANIVLDGDGIVPLRSQTAGLDTNNAIVDVYHGYHANHFGIRGIVGDKVFQLINSPVSGPLFREIPATNTSSSRILFKRNSVQSSNEIVSAIDTNKIKILSPVNSADCTTDSVLVIQIQVKDTVHAKYIEVNFQGENYLTTSIKPLINFNVQVKSEFLEKQQIIATVVYDVVDTTKFISDSVNVNVSIDQTIQSFTGGPEMNYLAKDQTIYPDYYATYSTFATKVGNNNSNLIVTINDPNIVSQDELSLGFKGKNDGETFAIVSYHGLLDTLYFAVGGTTSVLPVELTSFTALADSDKIILNWQTATEVNNYGFNIERKLENEEWQKIAFVQGHGNSNSPKDYSFKDSPQGGTKFKYRLKQIDFDGKYKYSNEVEITLKTPISFSIQQNYPNPFNPTTTIKYLIPAKSLVKIQIYDILGREVEKLVDEEQLPGTYEIKFNAKGLASGIYFYRLQAGGFLQTKKLVLIK